MFKGLNLTNMSLQTSDDKLSKKNKTCSFHCTALYYVIIINIKCLSVSSLQYIVGARAVWLAGPEVTMLVSNYHVTTVKVTRGVNS